MQVVWQTSLFYGECIQLQAAQDSVSNTQPTQLLYTIYAYHAVVALVHTYTSVFFQLEVQSYIQPKIMFVLCPPSPCSCLACGPSARLQIWVPVNRFYKYCCINHAYLSLHNIMQALALNVCVWPCVYIQYTLNFVLTCQPHVPGFQLPGLQLLFDWVGELVPHIIIIFMTCLCILMCAQHNLLDIRS